MTKLEKKINKQVSIIEAKLRMLGPKQDALIARMIEAGRGTERPSETRLLSDSLSVEYCALLDQQAALYAEKNAIMGNRPVIRV